MGKGPGLIYADSSFLVSLYLRDANSTTARNELNVLATRIGLSSLARLEVKNAFRLAVFREWITESQEARVQSLFDSDQQDGFLSPLPFTVEEIFSEAERLSKGHTACFGNRSLDVLHVACARVAGLDVFASFDIRQRKLAKQTGFITIPRVQ